MHVLWYFFRKNTGDRAVFWAIAGVFARYDCPRADAAFINVLHDRMHSRMVVCVCENKLCRVGIHPPAYLPFKLQSSRVAKPTARQLILDRLALPVAYLCVDGCLETSVGP